MPYRNFIFQKDQPFHIISRAVEERNIFADESDCYRFIFQIHAANIGKPNLNLRRLNVVETAQALLNGRGFPDNFIIQEHPPLVHILDFSLNVNHYHFYLVPANENSIPIFIKKLNGGFAKYFNLKHNRKGSLFGSRYKGIPIEDDLQSDTVSRYVSIVNPLDIYQPGWRESGLTDQNKALDFLENYQFSSFPDKIGKRHSKILAAPEILEKYSTGFKGDYIKFTKDFLEQKLTLSNLE